MNISAHKPFILTVGSDGLILTQHETVRSSFGQQLHSAAFKTNFEFFILSSIQRLAPFVHGNSRVWKERLFARGIA